MFKKYLSLLSLLFLIFISNANALEGIDISEYQGVIDFNEVVNDNIEVVYIRSSVGNSYVDNKFEENYEKAQAANLKIGFYHYVTARTTEEAEEQAKFFASVIAGKETDCYLAMDFEVFTGLTKDEVNDISLTFLKTLEELTTKKAIVYSDAYNAAYMFNEEVSTNYPLWIAEYDVEKPEVSNWQDYYGWQYTDTGKVNGIEGNVDRDYFKEEILIDDKTPIKEPEVDTNDNTKTIYYRIKKGDTLSYIANIYDIPLKTIIIENNITNPNLIYPNEVIKINPIYDYSITSTGTNTTYIVKKNDTLTKIAKIYNISISNLVTWNKITNPNLIYIGEKLEIKPTNNSHLIKYIVKKGNTLSEIASIYHVSIYELKQINDIKNINLIIPNEVIYIPESYIY